MASPSDNPFQSPQEVSLPWNKGIDSSDDSFDLLGWPLFISTLLIGVAMPLFCLWTAVLYYVWLPEAQTTVEIVRVWEYILGTGAMVFLQIPVLTCLLIARKAKLRWAAWIGFLGSMMPFVTSVFFWLLLPSGVWGIWVLVQTRKTQTVEVAD